MSVRNWLRQQGLGDQDRVLADIDVLSLSDLGVRIFWEDTEKEKVTMPVVPEQVRNAFKATVPAHMWSGEDLESMKLAFHKFDDGGNGSISLPELSDRLVHMGQSFSYKEVQEIMKTIDGANGDAVQDNEISFVEFCRILRAKSKGMEPASIQESIRKLFNHYDRDKSGTLDAKEVKKLLGNMGLKDIDPKHIIEQSDRDGDGVISFDEFYKMIAADNVASPAWRMMKYWLQLSSGWDSAPKSPEDISKLGSDDKVKVVSFIRHGESEANAACDVIGTAKGIFNPHITLKGIGQAKARREELKKQAEHFKFDLIVVSPMRRALETYSHAMADYITAGVPTIGHPLVREQFSESDDVGDAPSEIKSAWPGVDWSLFPDQPEVWWYAGETFTTEEAKGLTVLSQRELNIRDDWEEPWELVLERAQAFEEWVRARPEKHICVVSHGGFIEALVGPRMGNAEHFIIKL
jgi:Ca2+-binding EF-hand superfamily protein/broad specificity phosphatase PhoE